MESKLYVALVTPGASAGVKYRHGVALVSFFSLDMWVTYISYFNTFKSEEECKSIAFVGRFPRFARLSFTSSFESEDDYKTLVARYLRGKSKNSKRILSLRHSVRHKSHRDWPCLEPKLQW